MATNNAFDPMQDEDELDANALLKQLETAPPPPAGASAGAPTSNMMPVGGAVQALQQQAQAVMPPPTQAAAPASAFTPTAGARYDQWSGKGNVTGGNFGNVEGFDAGNFNDPNMQTAKYQAGRIMSRMNPNDPNALASILGDEEFKTLFPNARGVGPDKIDFGDGRPVDVIRGHGAPGAKFSWQTEDSGETSVDPYAAEGRAPASAPAPTAIDGPQTAQSPAQGADDPMAAILKEIEALQGGSASPMDQAELMKLLGI